jgi:hypothetical protein
LLIPSSEWAKFGDPFRSNGLLKGDSAWSSPRVEIHPLAADAAGAVIQKYAKRKDPWAAARLAQALGWRPNYLVQAAIYCGRTGMLFDTYRELFEFYRHYIIDVHEAIVQHSTHHANPQVNHE